MLQNDYLLSQIGADPAENEPYVKSDVSWRVSSEVEAALAFFRELAALSTQMNSHFRGLLGWQQHNLDLSLLTPELFSPILALFSLDERGACLNATPAEDCGA